MVAVSSSMSRISKREMPGEYKHKAAHCTYFSNVYAKELFENF
jgi:hypothetical protein